MSGQSSRSPLWTHAYSHLWTGRRLFIRKACAVRWGSCAIQYCALCTLRILCVNDDCKRLALGMGIRPET